jgi:hypothetical protein
MMLKIIGSYVAVHVIDSYERDIACVRDALRCRDTYEQSSHESRSVGDAYKIDIPDAHFCISERLVYDTVDVLEVSSGRYLRHDSAELGVDAYLRADYIAENVSSVRNYADRSLIAACFYSECKMSAVFH